MSLLNDVLRDLDQREPAQQSAQGVPESLLLAQQPGLWQSKFKMFGLLSLLTVMLLVFLTWFDWQWWFTSTKGIEIVKNSSGPDQAVVQLRPEDSAPIKELKAVAASAADLVAGPVTLSHSLIVSAHDTQADIAESEPLSARAAATGRQTGAVQSGADKPTASKPGHAGDPHRGVMHAGISRSSIAAKPQRVSLREAERVDNKTVRTDHSSVGALVVAASTVAASTVADATVADSTVADSTVTTSTAGIKPSADPEAVANRTLKKAQKLYQEGNPGGAEQMLQRLLTTSKHHRQSQIQLSQWLLARGAHQQAVGLLSDVNHSSLPELRALKAHSLIAMGKQHQALANLQNNPPLLADHPQFHSLRAGLLQQSGQFADALMIYAELVEVDPGEGAWWAGLGISLDQTGRPTSAARAYAQALADHQLSQPLAQYAEQRIRSISGHKLN